VKKKQLTLLLAGGALVLGFVSLYGVRRLHATAKVIPTARVRKGMVELDTRTDGELRTPHSAMMVAPSVSGTLQIVHLLQTGSAVKAGDVVVEFDPSEQQYNLEQSRSQLAEADQQIVQAKADADVKTSEDQVALLRAKFDVRRAELEVSRNELLSDIDAKKNVLNQEEAKRRLTQLEQDIKSRNLSNKASLALLVEKRQTALLGMQQAQRNIDQMTLKSPISGLVALKENQDAANGMFFTGMTLPEYREGDLVSPGRFLVEVLDVEKMEAVAKVFENDRPNINPGQQVEIRIDARPRSVYPAKVKTVAGMASQGGWGDTTRRFDVTFSLLSPETGIRPGTSSQITVHGSQLQDKLYLPRQCLFEKDGRPVVYVKHGEGFEAMNVKVAFRSENQIVVEGLSEGTEVALINPEEQLKQENKASSGPMGVGP